MKKTILFSLVLSGAAAFALSSCSNTPAAKLKTDVDSVSYAIGVNAGSNFKMNLDNTPGEPLNVDDLIAGFTTAIKGDTANVKMRPEQAMAIIQNYFTTLADKESKASKEASDKFIAEKSKEEGVQKTESGLLYKVVTEGTGAKPAADSRVKVNYKGTLADGTEFDSSYSRNEPATFVVNQVIPGWTEGLQLMNVGSKYIFYIPAELAYGEQGAGNKIKPNSALTFEVELLDIEPAAPAKPVKK